MLNLEDLKAIPGYENLYWVHPDGFIWNGRLKLKTYTINSGYHCVKLTKEHKAIAFLVHRLIAQTLLPNPEGKKEVNHINGDKSDNSLSNLEWVTSSENKQHARATGLSEYNLPSLGKKLGNKSKYHNVSWDAKREKWKACVRHNNKNLEQKRFDDEVDAAKHVNYVIEKYQLTGRPLNVFE